MKSVCLLFILLLAVSCGQQGGSGSGSGPDNESCNLNGRNVACHEIAGADGEGVDLLDALITVPVKIENTDITFMSDKSAMAQGRRINCRVGVKEGEIYRFALRGNTLLLMTQEGSIEMERLNEVIGSDPLLGAWKWDGYIDEGTHLIRQITFLTRDKVVMKNNCEL